MRVTAKINWKNKKKGEKLKALATLKFDNFFGVSVKIFKSKKGYFMSYPSYYNESKEEYVSQAFPCSKSARKKLDKLLEKLLKDGKEAYIIIKDEVDEDEVDEDEVDEDEVDEDEVDEDEDDSPF